MWHVSYWRNAPACLRLGKETSKLARSSLLLATVLVAACATEPVPMATPVPTLFTTTSSPEVPNSTRTSRPEPMVPPAPTPDPTVMPAATSTPTPEPTGTPSHTPISERTPTSTFTPTATSTIAPSATATATPTRTPTTTASPTPTATSTPQAVETVEATPTEIPDTAETVCSTTTDGNDTANSVREIFVGDSVAGEFESVGDAQHFMLCADANRSYEVSVEARSIPNVRLTVFDARGDEWSSVRTDYLRRETSTILHSWYPGPFLIAVEGQGRGDYKLSVADSDYHDDHGSRAELATEITLGGTVEGTIGVDRDIDFFKFRVVRGLFYTMNLTVAQNVHEPLTLRLQTADGTELCGHRALRTIRWAATETGYAYISVFELREEFDWTYTLTLEQSGPYDGHGDCASNATIISADKTVRVSYRTRGTDFFKFRADAGQAYQIDLSMDCCSSIKIRNDRFDVIAYLRGLDSATTLWQAWHSGDYFIEVDKNRVSGYELTLSRSNYKDDHGDDVASATGLKLGQSIDGDVGTGSDRDFFGFQAQAGQTYKLNLDLETGTEISVAIWDPNEARVVFVFRESGHKPIVFEAATTGISHVSLSEDYYLLAGAYNLTLEAYNFQDDYGDSVETASWIEPGSTIEGVLETGSDVDYFKFRANRGQSFSFGSAEYGLVTLRDADETWLAGPRTSGSEQYYVDRRYYPHRFQYGMVGLWQADATDVYYLRVTTNEPFIFKTWPYQIRFERSDYVDDHGDDVGSATEVELQQEVEGISVGERDFDFFRFNAEGGKRYRLIVSDDAERIGDDRPHWTNSPARAYLLGPDGNLIEAFRAGRAPLLQPEGNSFEALEFETVVLDVEIAESYFIAVSALYGRAHYRLKICEGDC